MASSSTNRILSLQALAAEANYFLRRWFQWWVNERGKESQELTENGSEMCTVQVISEREWKIRFKTPECEVKE